YPPVWSFLLSAVPSGAAPFVGRVVALACWFGVLGFIVVSAPRARRKVAAAFALFVASTFTLALYGASARPDALAAALAGIALHRAAHRAPKLDWMTGALFALAAWVKPNVVGAAPGAFVAAILFSAGSTGSKAAWGPIIRRAFRSIRGGLLGAAVVSILAT